MVHDKSQVWKKTTNATIHTLFTLSSSLLSIYVTEYVAAPVKLKLTQTDSGFQVRLRVRILPIKNGGKISPAVQAQTARCFVFPYLKMRYRCNMVDQVNVEFCLQLGLEMAWYLYSINLTSLFQKEAHGTQWKRRSVYVDQLGTTRFLAITYLKDINVRHVSAFLQMYWVHSIKSPNFMAY